MHFCKLEFSCIDDVGRAGPVGSQVATANIAGTNWALHQGTVENWTVFSFVAPQEITSFSADMLGFFSKSDLDLVRCCY